MSLCYSTIIMHIFFVIDLRQSLLFYSYGKIPFLKGATIIYTIIHTIHIFSVFIYGGFLIVDILFLSKMPRSLNEDEHAKAREAIMMHVRKVVPKALVVAVITGLYMFSQVFGEIKDSGLTYFQIVLAIKAFLGLWLGLRGVNQVFFGIQPWVFKSHYFPFSLVVTIILLSQLMYL
nr:hypothetical protein [uncultured Sulfurimonas sp.]